MKYEKWLSEWLENYVAPTSKQRTYVRYGELIDLHIAPALGNYEMEELSLDVMQRFVASLLISGNKKNGGGLSPNTICTIISVLRSSLKEAWRSGHSSFYVADRIKRPHKDEREVDCFTKDEQKRIEKAVMDSKKSKYMGILLCFYCGLRIGELLALTWSDIDMEREIMIVSKSCHDGKDENGKYRKIIESPKTKSSQRTIPLPIQLLPILKQLKKQRNCEYVVSENGKGVSVRSFQRTFDLLLKKLGVSHKGFHSLRHTFATRALECGMDVKTLSELLGHKNAAVTLNRYVHSLLEHKRDMMNRVGCLLR